MRDQQTIDRHQMRRKKRTTHPEQRSQLCLRLHLFQEHCAAIAKPFDACRGEELAASLQGCNAFIGKECLAIGECKVEPQRDGKHHRIRKCNWSCEETERNQRATKKLQASKQWRK